MSHRFFRLLVRLYPGAFRAEFEARLVELFDYRREEAVRRRGLFWRTRFWGFMTYDAVTSAWAERRRSFASVHMVRNGGGGGGMEGWLQDFRYSVRRLVRSPGFTISALAILAFGIGVNSAAFSLVNALLLQSPPFEEPDRLVELLQDSDGGGPSSTSYPAFQDISEYTDIFSSVSARAGGSATLDVDGSIAAVLVDYATSGFLGTLGLATSRGRWFERSEDFLGAEPVAVMSHRMWRNRFAADPEILGMALRLNGATVTVIGVGPDSYSGGYGAIAGDLWLSISAMTAVGGPAGSLTRRTDHPFRVAARLAPGVTPGAARAAMDRLADQLAADYPEVNRNRRIHVLPMTALGAERRAEIIPAAALVMFIVGLVLLVASINLANLLLVRGVARSRELGVRLALGGSRYRLVRILLGEVLVLAVAGGSLGLAMAWLFLDLLGRMQVALAGPITLDIRMDVTVLLFTVLVSLFASVIAGLLPALRSTSSGVTLLLNDRTAGRNRRRFGLVGMLVSAQVAVSLVLLVTAGLFIDRVMQSNAADPGFDPERLAIVRVALGPLELADQEVRPMFARLEESFENLQGVSEATLAYNVPVRQRGTTTLLVGDMVDGRRRPVEVPWNIVNPDYFRTLGVQLLHGRAFDEQDGLDDPQRAMVSEAMARAFWGRTDAVGESYVSENSPDSPVEIIGVVSNTSVRSVNEEPRPIVYWSTAQTIGSSMYFLVRTAGEAGSVLNPMREVVRETDRRIAVLSATTMELSLGESLTRQRLTSLLLLLVGAFALGLATVGIYAVVSFGVSQRVSEVGIRIALGAARTSVVSLFLREAAGVIGFGALVGLGLSWPVAHLIGALFTGTTGVPTTVLLAGVVTLSIPAFFATLLPARRAANLDPMRALRQE